MRLDLFLKASRLCPRRTVAQKICEAGRIFVNDKAAKSSYTVKPGDEIELRTHTRIKRVRVLIVPDTRQTSRADAANLVDVLNEEMVDEV